jgi:hypothetical protein
VSRGRWIWFSIALASALSRQAFTSTGSIYLVWQPISTGDYGIVISAVMYQGVNNPNPLGPVWATVEPNAVPYDGKPRDSNAAALYGIKIDVKPTDLDRFDQDLDTLRVTLTVPADDDTSKREWKADAPEVVPATAQCVLLNAHQMWPHVRYVDLRIKGSRRWTIYEGVHSLENVKLPSRPLQLERGKLFDMQD